MASRAASEVADFGVGVCRRVERWGCESRTDARFERCAWRVANLAFKACMSLSRSSIVDIVDVVNFRAGVYEDDDARGVVNPSRKHVPDRDTRRRLDSADALRGHGSIQAHFCCSTCDRGLIAAYRAPQQRISAAL